METLSREFDVTCTSGQNITREEIRQLKPDIFIIHQSGQSLRESEDMYNIFFTSGIPVMLLGSLLNHDVRNLVKKGVVQDYIPMPFTTDDLVARAHVLISRKKSVERLYEALSGTARDVSSLEVRIAMERLETKRAYTKLKEQQKLMQSILNASPMAVFVNDLDGRLLYHNSLYTEIFGDDREVIDLSHDGTGQEIDHETLNEHEMLLSGQQPLQRYIAVTDNEGKERFFLSLKFPLFNDSGAPYAICGLATDISDRVELEQRKNEFIASASHELKTPVTAIKVLLELLNQRKEALDSVGTEAVDRIYGQIDRLSRLITDLLDLSKLQANAVQYDLERVDFVTVVRTAIRSLGQAHIPNRITFSGRRSVEIIADRRHLGQAIRNIIANAIKFSPGREQVEVDIQKEGGHLHCSIRDHGVGIRREHLPNIFNCFYRIEDGTRETFPGLGIGLFVTSEIIRGHGGSISVESSPGKGSVFHVYLPLAGRSVARKKIKGREKTYEKNRGR
jgi:PAS domain S-box-containing protein